MLFIALFNLIDYTNQTNFFEHKPNFFRVADRLHPIYLAAWHSPVPSFRIAQPLKQ